MCIVKAIESAMEPAEHHCLVNPLRTVVTLDKCHAKEIAVCSVGVHVGTGLKTTELSCTC